MKKFIFLFVAFAMFMFVACKSTPKDVVDNETQVADTTVVDTTVVDSVVVDTLK